MQLGEKKFSGKDGEREREKDREREKEKGREREREREGIRCKDMVTNRLTNCKKRAHMKQS